MKKNILLTTILLISFSVAHATVWRLNNRPGTDADFTSLQEAHDAVFQGNQVVQPGDTLYLEASSGSYGDLVAEKQLVIIGSGFFTAENLNNQADINPSKVTDITFNDGSQGSVISGCQIQHVIVNTSDIVIERNYLTSSAQPSHLIRINNNEDSYINNILIRNNYFLNTNTYTGGIGNRRHASCIIAEDDGLNNISVIGNYMEVMIYNEKHALLLEEGFSGIIKNNVIYGDVVVHNASFNNNILRDGDFTSTNTSYTNNIGNSMQFGFSNGNLSGINMDDVFVGTGSTDGQWQLKEGSPAIGAGVGGTDCGMFGGETPWVLSGIPKIPAIYQLDLNVDNVNQQIEVEMSVKSRN